MVAAAAKSPHIMPVQKDRPAKLARLNALRSKMPYISHTALTAVLRIAKDDPLPEVNNRVDVRHARKAVARQSTPYGTLVSTIPMEGKHGKPKHVPLQSPHGMLWLAAQTKRYGTVLRERLAAVPSTLANPWRIILYSDEVTPGNVAKSCNARIEQAVYFTFVELGAAAFSKEDFWFEASVVRSNTVRQIQGGMSAVTAEVLARMFDKRGHNFATSGIMIQPHGSAKPMRFFATLGGILADESALHATWMCMGANGIKPCIECANITMPDWVARMKLPHGHFFKSYTAVFDESQCVRHTQTTIRSIVDDLHAVHESKTLTATAFGAKETSLGFRYNRRMLLLHPDLREIVDPSQQNCFDWAHCVLSGVFPRQLGAMAEDLSEHGVKFYKMMDEFLQDWHWPRRLEGRAATGKGAFHDRRGAACHTAKSFAGSMSEALSLHLVISFWVLRVVVRGKVPTKSAIAWLRLSHLIDLLFHSNHPIVTPDKIRNAVRLHFVAFIDAFGGDLMTIKHHFMVHFARLCEKFGWVFNVMVCERKHKRIRAWAEVLDNTGDCTEATVLEEVTCMHLAILEDAEWLDMSLGLVGPTQPSKKLLAWCRENIGADGAYLSANALRFSESGRCYRGDVIAYKTPTPRGWGVAKVWYNCSGDGECFCVVTLLYEDILGRTELSSSWRELDATDPTILMMDDLLDVLIWRCVADVLTVLHPLPLR